MPGTDPATWNFSPVQVHSTYASGQVRIELTAFNNFLRQLQGAGLEMQRELIRYGLEILKRIQMRTPVDTARARNSWHAVLPNQGDSYQYNSNARHRDGTPITGPTSFDGTLDVHAGPWDMFVGSNVEYMLFLEAGHSQQAPNGMVAVTLAEMTGALEARLERIFQQIGH